jgi:hypothetical protein
VSADDFLRAEVFDGRFFQFNMVHATGADSATGGRGFVWVRLQGRRLSTRSLSRRAGIAAKREAESSNRARGKSRRFTPIHSLSIHFFAPSLAYPFTCSPAQSPIPTPFATVRHRSWHPLCKVRERAKVVLLLRAAAPKVWDSCKTIVDGQPLVFPRFSSLHIERVPI